VKTPFNSLRRRLKRPSPSMIVAMAALFVALGGGAYAAVATTAEQAAHSKGAHWGLITRNTIGSAVGDLRSGPYGSFGVDQTDPAHAKPPLGTGSLGLQVSDNAMSGGTPQEKVSFGNEVDFFGDQVQNLTAIGYRVFQTSENAAINPSNLPNITLEIDPNVGTSNYTSMVWVPNPIPSGQLDRWSDFQSAAHTGQWYFTGSAGTVTGCNQTTMCTFANAKQSLVTNNNGQNPVGGSIYTVAIAKGRDNAWVGAVDGLRINGTRYDFEAYGVNDTPAQG
jgi:hypothetical protein